MHIFYLNISILLLLYSDYEFKSRKKYKLGYLKDELAKKFHGDKLWQKKKKNSLSTGIITF